MYGNVSMHYRYVKVCYVVDKKERKKERFHALELMPISE